MYTGLREGLVDTGLIRAEGTATLQHERHAFEGGALVQQSGHVAGPEHSWHALFILWPMILDQWPMETAPQSFDLAQRKCEQAQPTAHASSLAQAHAPSNASEPIIAL